MLFSKPESLDTELAEDFFSDFQDAHARCEANLISLEHAPNNLELIRELFRSVHTIKGNLIYIGLKHLCPLLQSVEDILEELRSGHITYDDLMSDVILLAMDITKRLVEEEILDQQSSYSVNEFDKICHAIHKISTAKENYRPTLIHEALQLLEGTALDKPDQPANDVAVYYKHVPDFLSRYGVNDHPDLQLMINLAPALEARSPYWMGRTEQIARLALAMNDYVNVIVDPNQLAMAAYSHDIGMAFLPLDLLHKKHPYSNEEHRLVRGHIRFSSEPLQRLGWEEACEMVVQHHEHCSGGGYPLGLTDDQICDGAKIIAIADAFHACRYGRPHHKEFKRPLIRAVLEINRHAGSQFSQFWVDAFNQVANRPN
ncbi:HD-GYP domain-containing protein [Marinibactrum halimedae]|uniref:HD domain-containing protein n=1 Tax=Marinibactrum halimedae TaxID=1444977 RepID=A0AA37T2S7_9GAMM|nr:HD domain-containing phosphohydrolase [Marinibactrum halimedae]MCD9457498.1 HD domain-containing protein [Marinibactrum halimedae]GLS25448.1 hypothetical protein GCM10007877_11620 [Marinibactrum halimedae]